MNDTEQPTAGVVLIGNELLSGKTQDANLSFLGSELARLGIRLVEARVIRDEHATIAAVINEFRRQFTYVFTTGGIGPTHDDITAESVAMAFGTKLEINEDALRAMAKSRRPMNDARRKMAMIPIGATLIENEVSLAPGFRIENVFVLAGIPRIARVMFKALEGDLEGAEQILSMSVDAYAPEGDIARPLEQIADRCRQVEIGSYPFQRDGRYGASLVVRGTDPAAVRSALDEIAAALDSLGIERSPGS